MSAFGVLAIVAVAHAAEPVLGPAWKPTEESIVLPTGAKAYATYHFNRNALSAACLVEDNLLTVTDSGNLLRFDLKDLRLQQEVRPEQAISLLVNAEGIGVLAAAADGRIFSVEPTSLKMTEFARLSAAPTWMTGYTQSASHKKGVLAVVEIPLRQRNDEAIEVHRLGNNSPTSTRHQVPATIRRSGISAFLLDRKSRLWLGKDMGEWGGWCGLLDLSSGKAVAVEEVECPSGIYGFFELPDGQVWAYGGTMHLGHSSAYIARVDRGKLEFLGKYDGGFGTKAAAMPKQPRYPITHLIPDPKNDGLLVFSYSDLFRVDAKLTNWRHLGNIELRYRSGRPDAMGAYPALRTIIAVGDKTGDLIGTTAQDGLLRIREGQFTQYLVPAQIGDDWIQTILPGNGTSLLDGSNLWRYTADGWQATSIFPPTPPNERDSWYEYRLMLDPERRPVAICRSNIIPGSTALTRWKDGKVEILASETGRHISFSARGGFATPDGSYWCADYGELLRLVNGKWKVVGKRPDKSLWGLRVVGQDQPPWTLHCENKLYRLTPENGAHEATLTPISLSIDLGDIHGALPFKSGQILLACAKGFRLFDEKSENISECPFAAPNGVVRALCRDGRGRIWLAGSSLWMVDAKGKVYDFSKLNRYGAMAHAIGADSKNADGVIAALGWRGVLFVRAENIDR